MKNLFARAGIGAAFAAALLLPAAVVAQEAAVTANAGWVSEYYYRGIPQKTSSANAGLDLGIGPVYVGTWAADVGEGAEVDLYAGAGLDLEGLSLSAGGTGYFYTGDFDDTYLEANLGAGYGPLGVEFSFGQYENFDGPTQDYTFLALTLEQAGFYATVGSFGSDFDGEYGEAGYGFTAADLDFSVAWIYSTEELSLLEDAAGDPTDDHTLVFGVSRTFDLLP